MANTPATNDNSAWHPTRELREALIHKLEHSHSRLTELRIASVEEKLLGMPSADLEGVLLKLHLLWSAQLDGDSDEARHKRLILEDLAYLI